ncbi:hypothetical protein N2152v2_008912 [Parachlorella kessleri]
MPDDVEAYAGLLHTIRALEKAKVTERLAEAKQLQTSLLTELEHKQGCRQKLCGALKVTQEKLTDYQEGFFTNLIMNDKEKSRKLEKHSKLLEQEQQDLAACDKCIAALTTQLQQCEAQVASLGGQVAELQLLQQRASAQLLQLFSSPGWQRDAGYLGLQQFFKQLDAEAAAAGAMVSACRQAKPLMERASDKLLSALDALDWMVTLANRWHRPTPGVNQARKHMSSMPEIQVACIDPNRCLGGPFMVSDFYERRLVLGEAQEATHQTSKMLLQVKDCHSWVVSTLTAAEQRHASAEAARGQKAAELDSFRLRLAQEAVASLGRKGRQEAHEVQDDPSAPGVPSIAEGIPVM